MMNKTTTYTARNVVMIAYPDAHILDIVGPLEVLTGAKLFLGDDAPEPYNVKVVAAKAGPFSTTSGLTLQADESFAQAHEEDAKIDTLIISGGHGTLDAMEDEDLMAFTRWAAQKANRVVSICTGAMILGELGLLNGRRATTHWWWCPILSQKYPDIQVDPDAIFVHDGKYWTSAGVTAGMDLALALVESDWGHDVALQVARYNVMYMMRPGGQSQFSAQLLAQKTDNGPIGKIMDFIVNNLDRDLTVPELAKRACMSDRSFARKFKDMASVTPANFVEAARIQAARQALEQTDASIDMIAAQTGFNSAERMRRAFQKRERNPTLCRGFASVCKK